MNSLNPENVSRFIGATICVNKRKYRVSKRDRKTTDITIPWAPVRAKNQNLGYRINQTNDYFRWQWLEPSNERHYTWGLSGVRRRLSLVWQSNEFRKKSDWGFLTLDNVHSSSTVVRKMLHLQVHQQDCMKQSVNLPQVFVFVGLLLNCKAFNFKKLYLPLQRFAKKLTILAKKEYNLFEE